MIKHIIFDFDGVIIDSLSIKATAFAMALKEFPRDKVNQFLQYNELHGGVSRFEKFRYFYREILKVDFTDGDIQEHLDCFSREIKKTLLNGNYLIDEAVNFILKNSDMYSMHIASASEEEELICICNHFRLSTNFKSIYGSPIFKKDIVARILVENDYDPSEVVLIGDSMSDKEAAEVNKIVFVGYNNEKLKGSGFYYIDSFIDLNINEMKRL